MSPETVKEETEDPVDAVNVPTPTMTTNDSYLSKKTYDIPQLKDDGSNYTAWKFRQTTVLRLRGLLSIANGTETTPEPLTEAESKDPAKVDAKNKEVAKWRKRDEDAFAQIALNMEDGAMTDVIEATTAYEAWTKVVERWEGKGMQSLSFLYQQLTNTKIEEEEDIATGFNKLRAIASKMKTLGEPITDLMLAQIFMNALPPSYTIVSTVIQTSNQSNLVTSDMVVKAALAEEERRKKGVGLTAMFSQASKPALKKSSNPKGKKKPKGPACDNCGKSGHAKAECWAKGGGAEGTGPRQKRRDAKPGESKPNESSSTSKVESAKIAIASAATDDAPTLYALPALSDASIRSAWLLDSGASKHMTANRQWFSTYQPLVPPIAVRVGDGNRIYATGIGRIRLILRDRSRKETPAVLQSVLHVPELHANLISVRELVRNRFVVHFGEHGVHLLADRGNGPEIAFASGSEGDLYRLDARVTHTKAVAHIASVGPENSNDENDAEASEFVAYTATHVARADLHTWHRRLGHVSYKYVLDMVKKGAVEGMDIVGSRLPPQSKCEPCLKGKHTRSPFPTSENRASEVLELLHSDLHGPLPLQAVQGVKYFAVTIDDKSRKIFVHLLREKSDYVPRFKELKTSIENLTGKRIKHLRTDGGGEYGSNAFQAWLKANGIEHQKTEADSSASNGVAERAIRTINDSQRAMRADSDLPESYWGYAVLHAAHIWNVTPKRSLDGKTPDEVFTGKAPDVSRLRTFGCKAWARVPDDQGTKLDARSIECNYLGFAPNRKAHILVQRSTRRILTSRDVVFDEGLPTRQRVVIEHDEDDPLLEQVGDQEHVESSPKVTEPEPKPQERPSEPEVEPEPQNEPPVEPEPELVHLEPPRRSSRISRPPVRYGAEVGAQNESATRADRPTAESAFDASIQVPPDDFNEAMARPDANLWLEAMLEEIKSITEHKVWKPAKRPTHKKVIKCRWVFAYKRAVDGEITKYKARLVAKGFLQAPGTDYVEISSPVAAADAYRVLFSIVASEDLELLQMDIKTAFLHGVIEEELYMEQPEGFVDGDHVWQLVKALYGLKQAARAFYLRLKEVLEGIGFTRTESDHAVFILRDGDNLAIILAHVDDMLLAGKPLSFLESIKSKLRKSFDIVDLGEARMFVGVEIERDRAAGTLKICQKRYITDILARFSMSESKSCDTPMAESPNLPKLESPTIDRTLYQRGVGSLMYAMISTRPDIGFATGLLAQHAANPGDEHWSAFKRVLRYLQGTKALGIVFDRSKPSSLSGYVDSDYAGDPNTSRSTTGWVFHIAGGAIAWSSRKQPTISLSSTEAEYVAAASAARQLLWLRQFLAELGFLPDGPTTLLTDNQSSIALAKNPVNHQNTKHIRVKYHFIREVIELREVDLQFISTNHQVADVLTKSLGRVKFPGFVAGMGML